MADFTAVNAFLSKQPDLRRGQGARTGELRALQVKWGTVPPDYMSYLKTYGWATFGSTELLGLGVDVPDHLALLDRAETLWAGASIKIPTQLLPIHESSGDWYYCLSKFHPGQPVVFWSVEYEATGEVQPYDEMYDTWSDWFMLRVAT